MPYDDEPFVSTADRFDESIGYTPRGRRGDAIRDANVESQIDARNAGLELRRQNMELQQKASDLDYSRFELDVLKTKTEIEKQKVARDYEIRTEKETAAVIPLLGKLKTTDPEFEQKIALIQAKYPVGVRDRVVSSMIEGAGGIMDRRREAAATRAKFQEAYGVDPHQYQKWSKDGEFDGIDWDMANSVAKRNAQDASKKTSSDPQFRNLKMVFDPYTREMVPQSAELAPENAALVNAALNKGVPLTEKQAAELDASTPAVTERTVALASGDALQRQQQAKGLQVQIKAAQANLNNLTAVAKGFPSEDQAKEIAMRKSQLAELGLRHAGLVSPMDGDTAPVAPAPSAPAPSVPAQAMPGAPDRKARAQQALKDPNAPENVKARAREILGLPPLPAGD